MINRDWADWAVAEVLLPASLLFGGSVGLVKGYTRASILLFGIVQTLKREDQTTMSEAARDFFTKPLGSELFFWFLSGDMFRV